MSSQFEAEANRDISKPIVQLASEYYEEVVKNPDTKPTQAIGNAQKKMVSMMAKVALSNEAVQRSNGILERRLYWLAWAVAGLTILSTIFGGIQAAGVVASWPK